jgi:uncharacterized protein YndB with AHSA1/START domain
MSSSIRLTWHLCAPRERVYRALTDARAVGRWRVPPGMRSEVHAFDARVDGAIRVSLTYAAPGAAGKSGAHTDTYRGHFAALVADERVVEVLEFETDDPALQGTMRVSFELHDEPGGTRLLARHDGVPRGIAPADNEKGWREALARLAGLVEGDAGPATPAPRLDSSMSRTKPGRS